MNAVYLKKRAINDLLHLFFQLIEWKEHPLTYFEAGNYINDIESECYKINSLSLNHRAVYQDHKRFGKYVHRYDKHSNIQWFIVYDFDKYGNILIKKIKSNLTTKK